jgi:hypothetical protein
MLLYSGNESAGEFHALVEHPPAFSRTGLRYPTASELAMVNYVSINCVTHTTVSSRHREYFNGNCPRCLRARNHTSKALLVCDDAMHLINACRRMTIQSMASMPRTSCSYSISPCFMSSMMMSMGSISMLSCDCAILCLSP